MALIPSSDPLRDSVGLGWNPSTRDASSEVTEDLVMRDTPVTAGAVRRSLSITLHKIYMTRQNLFKG